MSTFDGGRKNESGETKRQTRPIYRIGDGLGMPGVASGMAGRGAVPAKLNTQALGSGLGSRFQMRRLQTGRFIAGWLWRRPT